MEIVKDSKNRQYKKTESGTCYHIETSEQVINVLESLFNTRQTRIRIWYGENGKSWDEENGVTGYLGRSTGTIKIPLLINNSRSLGGDGLLDSSIVKIVNTKTKRVLYQHSNFSQSKFEVTNPDLKEYEANVNKDGELYARCKTIISAKRLADFMNGLRFNK